MDAVPAVPGDPDLEFVITAWASLPPTVKAGLVAIMRAASIHKEVQ